MIDDLAAAQAVGDVDVVVEREARVIGPQLRVLFGEAGVPGFVDVGPAVAVGVFHVGDSAGEGHEHAALPRLQAGGKVEVVGKDGRGFEEAVVVRVFQNRDARARTAFGGRGIVAHLDDPHAAVFVEADGDGVDDIGLAGDKLDFQSGFDDEMLQRFMRRDWTVNRQRFGRACASELAQ